MIPLKLTPEAWKEGDWQGRFLCLVISTEIGPIPFSVAEQHDVLKNKATHFQNTFILSKGEVLRYRCVVTSELMSYLQCKYSLKKLKLGYE